MRNICPVCGYDHLFEPPYDPEWGYASDEICPCCGFQFGLDDYPDKEAAMEKWRNDWFANGNPWFSKDRKPPDGRQQNPQANGCEE